LYFLQKDVGLYDQMQVNKESELDVDSKQVLDLV